jgi:hypothetical protein
MPGTRRTIPVSIRKRLYASHGGLCAFPECPYPASMPDGTPLLHIAHIYSFASMGPRGNPALSPSEVNDESNLILLCPSHHAVIDTIPSEYPAERLLKFGMNISHASQGSCHPLTGISRQASPTRTSVLSTRLNWR